MFDKQESNISHPTFILLAVILPLLLLAAICFAADAEAAVLQVSTICETTDGSVPVQRAGIDRVLAAMKTAAANLSSDNIRAARIEACLMEHSLLAKRRVLIEATKEAKTADELRLIRAAAGSEWRLRDLLYTIATYLTDGVTRGADKIDVLELSLEVQKENDNFESDWRWFIQSQSSPKKK